MHIILTDHEVTLSTADRIELDTRRLTLVTSTESYVISQNADGSVRIEAPGGKLTLDVVSTEPMVARAEAKGSCRACATRAAKKLEGPCRACAARARWTGPKLIESPEPKTVKCETCGGTIQYMPSDLFRTRSLPGSDDVGDMAVKCPGPRCGGRGYPR